MRTRLILIRHGETSYNADRKYCGHIDAPLNAKGEGQARGLRKRLAGVPLDTVYSSDLKRAVQTARIALGGVRIVRSGQLREMNFGALEGLTYEAAQIKYPARYGKWLKDPLKTPAFPRAESMAAFKKRISGALAEIIAAERGGSAAVFCHGGLIGVFLSDILGTGDIWRYIPGSASVSVVEYLDDKPDVKLFNFLGRRRIPLGK